jgi:hypothetical protein
LQTGLDLPEQLAPSVQQAVPAPEQLLSPVHMMVVCVALLCSEVPHDCTPSQVMSQVLGVLKHLGSLHDCRPGQVMSQSLARQMIGRVEHDFAPEQAMVQLLPAHSTPFKQLESPHVI